MIEHIFSSARVLRRLRTSVFCAAIDDYVTYLTERGHPQSTIQQYVQAVEHFGAWLRRTRCSVERVDEQVIERFVHGHLARCACPPPIDESWREWWARGACHRARIRATRWLCPRSSLNSQQVDMWKFVESDYDHLRIYEPHESTKDVRPSPGFSQG